MDFNNKFEFDWDDSGAFEPSEELRTKGFTGGYKPPAGVFNWFWSLTIKAITELQSKLKAIALSDISETATRKVNHIAEATSSDGALYVANVPEITALYNGLELTIIPNMTSKKAAVQFNLNGWGAKNVRMKLPFNSGNSGSLASSDTWIGADSPVTLRYLSKHDMWQTDLQRQSAQSLYGIVPVDGGGTGGDTAEEARANLQVAQAIEHSTYSGCYYRLVDGVEEWINPPLLENHFYQTCERFHGEPIQVAALTFDGTQTAYTFPGKAYEHPVKILSMCGVIYSDNGDIHSLDSSVLAMVGGDAEGNNTVTLIDTSAKVASAEVYVKFILT